MTNNQGKISIKGLIIIVSLFLCAILLLFLGVFLSYTGNKNKVVKETVDIMSNTLENIVSKDERFYLDNNFTIESNIDSYVKLDETNTEIKEYIDFLNNISKIKTNIKIIQDGDNSKLLYSINSTKNNENYINTKYLVKDSTGYYYNNSITNKYINVGNNNYFETINDDITTNANINYLKEIIRDSLSDNLSNNYSKQIRAEVNYNNTYVNASKIEIELDNKKMNKLYKDIINDLKNDNKSSKLLNNYIEGFKDKKIKNKKFLDKNETIKINIYTKGLTNKFIKLEVIYKKDKKENTISYEKINNNKGNIYIISNNKVEYKLEVNKIDNNYNITVYNKNDKNIGNITFNKTEKETVLDVSVNDNNKRIDIDYKVNYKTIKEKNYKEDIRLDIKYLIKNNNILTLSAEIDNTISTDVSIKEDTSESILEKTLTEEQKIKKDQFIDNKLKEILGGLYEKRN